MKLIRILSVLLLLCCIALFAVAPAAAKESPSIVSTVATQSGITVDEAKSQVDAVFRALTVELQAGRAVQIRRFGKFYVQERAPRKARNPRTGDPIDVPAKKYPKFSSSEILKEQLNGS